MQQTLPAGRGMGEKGGRVETRRSVMTLLAVCCMRTEVPWNGVALLEMESSGRIQEVGDRLQKTYG